MSNQDGTDKRQTFVSVVQLRPIYWFSVPWCQVCLFRFPPLGCLSKESNRPLGFELSPAARAWGRHQQGWVVGPTISDTGDWIWAIQLFQRWGKNMTYFTPWIYNRLMEIRLESVHSKCSAPSRGSNSLIVQDCLVVHPFCLILCCYRFSRLLIFLELFTERSWHR